MSFIGKLFRKDKFNFEYNEVEVEKIMKDMAAEKKMQYPPKPPAPLPPPRVQSGVSSYTPAKEPFHMFNCYMCLKKVTEIDPYVEIMHYKPHPEKTTRKHFHVECFREVAGDQYL